MTDKICPLCGEPEAYYGHDDGCRCCTECKKTAPAMNHLNALEIASARLVSIVSEWQAGHISNKYLKSASDEVARILMSAPAKRCGG